MKPLLLEAKNLHKVFHFPEKTAILRGVSLEVFAGDSIAILGASGEGKTTLLHILGGLDLPDQGSLYILGKPPSRDALLHEVGFIFQNFNLLEDLTVLENVLLPARIARHPLSEKLYHRAETLLEEVNLSARKHFPARVLSGGEKQRCALARALINEPALLLADEPSGNLDHATSQQMHQLLLKVTKQQSQGLIIATHDWELASLCKKKWALKEGCLFPVNEKSSIFKEG